MEAFFERCWRVIDQPILETFWNRMDAGKSLYVGFNAIEAALWMALGVFVIARSLRHRRLFVEFVYSFSFAAFGLTDVLEMHRLTVGLLGTKLFVLISILLCRHIVIQHYPGAKL
jgi:hypothetical protein